METGLSTTQVLAQKREFGKNTITTTQHFSALKLLVSQFPTLLNGILLVGAVFSLLINDPIDASFIFAVLLINGVIGFVQEYRAEKSLEKLKTLVTPLSRVIRDEKETEIPTSDLVPGDLVILSEGDRVPADGTLSQSHHIAVDEAMLTGESLAVVKTHSDTVFAGTLVTKGTGHMKVIQIGMNTRLGKIAATLTTVKADKTPLQIKLDGLGKLISLIAILFAALIIPVSLSHGAALIPTILVAVSVAIAAIPEGLPAVVTIALAIGTSRMAKKNAIVRKMPVVETLGAVQVVLIDKTGTLTKNQMRVKTHWLTKENTLPALLKASLLGNTASIVEKISTQGGPASGWDVLGDQTDGALLLWAIEQNYDMQKFHESGKLLEEFTFDPETATITNVWEENGTKHVFVRGAPEVLLEKSIGTNEEKEVISQQIETFAKQGLRVIGFAQKADENHNIHDRTHVEKHLQFLGIVGIYDAPRDEARAAVLEAKRAGIHTVMVTGDNETTALTIAREVGLIENNEDVITGDELDAMPDEEVLKILPHVRIFARSKPEDKLRLVELFKKAGFVVGVTGDGVNDALALKRSDVGIAMGDSGTDVAKEASDIILTDDNFSTLVKAVEEGRTIYKNIQTAITYLLAGNLSEITFIFFASLLGLSTPFHPTQILWINIITDGLPALALASDVKDENVLNEKPRDPNAPFLSKNRIFLIVFTGLSISVSLLLTYALLLNQNSVVFARTIVFNLILFLHLVIIFFLRDKSIFRVNRFLVISIIVSIAAQILVNILPIFRVIFDIQ